MGNSHTDGHGQTRTGTDRKRGRWFYLELGTLWRGQNAEVRGQGEPNSQQPFNARGANETQTTQAIFWGRGAQAGAKGRSAALSTPAQGRWMGREGGGRNSHTDKYGRTRTDTDRKRGTKVFFVCGFCVEGFLGFS